MWRKGNPPTLLVGMSIGRATIENSMGFLKRLKIELPYDLAILLLGMQKKTSKRCMHPFVQNSTSHSSRDMEAI